METFVKDYDKVIKKQRTLENNDPLDRLINIVNEAKDKIRAGNIEPWKGWLSLPHFIKKRPVCAPLRLPKADPWLCLLTLLAIDPSSVSASLSALGKTIKTVSNGISEEHKELQSALSKYSKAIDKVRCKWDYTRTSAFLE